MFVLILYQFVYCVSCVCLIFVSNGKCKGSVELTCSVSLSLKYY